MLMPKRTKYRKAHRGRRRGMSKGNQQVNFGEYGLKSLENGWITNRQIESARVAMTRYIKRQGKVWINLFPHLPVTKKPAETRMGSGKGSPESWVSVVKPGMVCRWSSRAWSCSSCRACPRRPRARPCASPR